MKTKKQKYGCTVGTTLARYAYMYSFQNAQFKRYAYKGCPKSICGWGNKLYTVFKMLNSTANNKINKEKLLYHI